MTNQISYESIEKALEKIDNLSDEALDRLIETYMMSQQELVDHIMQAGFEYENEDLNMYSLYYFAIIYEAFLQQNITPRKITEADIEAFNEPFLQALDAIHEKDNYEPLHELIEQVNLQEFIIAELEAEDEDGSTLDDEIKTQLFVVSSGIIGLLNEATS